MLWALLAVVNPIAIEAHCMGFGVSALSPLCKDLEDGFAVWACCLFGLVHSRRGRQRRLFQWFL